MKGKSLLKSKATRIVLLEKTEHFVVQIKVTKPRNIGWWYEGENDGEKFEVRKGTNADRAERPVHISNLMDKPFYIVLKHHKKSNIGNLIFKEDTVRIEKSKVY